MPGAVPKDAHLDGTSPYCQTGRRSRTKGHCILDSRLGLAAYPAWHLPWTITGLGVKPGFNTVLFWATLCRYLMTVLLPSVGVADRTVRQAGLLQQLVLLQPYP